MSKSKINKIVIDLQSKEEKTIILALMYIPRLRFDSYLQENQLATLTNLLHHFQSSQNPDITYLSRKAQNFLSKHYNEQYQINKSEIKTNKNSTYSELTDIKISSEKKSPLDTNLSPDSINEQNFYDFFNHSDSRLRAQAVEICTNTIPENQLAKLLTPLLDDQNNRVRANVIVGLKKSSPETLKHSLQDMLSSPQIGMRESAIWAISKLNCHEFYRRILMKALHDPYRDIRIRAIEALRAYNFNEVVIQMKRLATDSDDLISQKAVETLQHFSTFKVNLIDKNNQTMPEIANPKQNSITMNHDSENSINIDSKFLDLSKSYEKINDSKKQFLNNQSGKSNQLLLNTKEIATKIALHQKLESLDVEEFFDTINPTENISNHNSKIESTTFSSPELDILSWIPKEYQPDKYKETLSAQIESVKDNDCEATILRNRISKLLLEVGHLEFNRHKKFKSPNTSLNLAFDKIISIMQKIHSVHNNSKLQNDKKRMIIKQLKQRSNEALIFLGRTSIKLHNRNNHKCNNIKRYQRELRILVDRLSKLS